MREVDALAAGERADRRGLGATVQHVADQPAGVVAVLVLGDGAERARRAEPARDELADLGGVAVTSQTEWPAGDVLVEQPLRARVDAQAEDLVVDVLGDRGHLRDRVARS